MAECDDAIPSACLSMPLMLRGVIEGLPRLLVVFAMVLAVVFEIDGRPRFYRTLDRPNLKADLRLVARGRVPMQRVFEPSRDFRRLKVAGQNFTIGCVVTV